jgi:molecular chaperone IbpA
MTQSMFALLSQMDSVIKDPRILGFEPTFQRLERVVNQPRNDSFPPHNIVYSKDNESFKVEMALAGYAEDDFKITLQDQVLTIETYEELEQPKEEYVHQGIARRKFRKTFTLGEYLVVEGAEFVNGLLTITINKELPEEKKPKTIKINGKKTKKSSLLTE